MFDPDYRAALAEFLPHAGRDYAEGRNTDNGPDRPRTVSALSPWIRLRVLPEWEVIAEVLQQHSAEAASKFIDEVFWRTYWKGWLQLRPSIWSEYRDRVHALLGSEAQTPGFQQAMAGQTGIDCFDAWARELVATGYLHNHARMWTASIWIHTLKLPWELGADWFWRHLLDGDAASNTLSWRWVAGLQTVGKTYLATRENIRRYTGDRFEVTGKLATEPVALAAAPPPPLQPLVPPSEIAPGRRVGLLLTDDDLSAGEWVPARAEVAACAAWFPRAIYAQMGLAEPVVRFRRQAMQLAHDAAGGAGVWDTESDFKNWLENSKIEVLVMAEPQIGIWSELMPDLVAMCRDAGIELVPLRHAWDERLWPRASHGFFRFKKEIPQALRELIPSP